MKAKLKIIIPTSIVIILISIIIFLSIPHSLSNTLRFDDSEWVSVLLAII